MKAIIPVAGAGTKLRPHSYSQPKALIPLAGKTVLSIIIDQLREAGINEFIFIVGYLGEKIEDHVKIKYPDLKANQNFLELQAQLEGTENRIAVARRNFNESVVTYNANIRTFPNNIFAGWYGFETKGTFQASAGAENAPTVQF